MAEQKNPSAHPRGRFTSILDPWRGFRLSRIYLYVIYCVFPAGSASVDAGASAGCDVVFVAGETISALAYLFDTLVILTLSFCPVFAPTTKMMNPCIFAIPSPRLEISVISTSYSSPALTGFGAKLLGPPKLP